MVQQLEDVTFDDGDAFLNRYLHICVERDIRTRLELTEMPRNRNPKDIVLRASPPRGSICHFCAYD
jgi:hypothetical protein